MRIDSLYYAASQLESAANWLDHITNGWEARDRVKSFRDTAREAMREYEALSNIMPDVRAYIQQKAEAYDAYVTREPDWGDGGCSCHINPPCGYCTRQADEEEEE